jgi:hypothetical protein
MKKCLVFCLFVLAICIAGSHSANAQTNDPAAEKVKTDVHKRGQGKKVVVTLENGSRLKGHISQILDDSFDLKETAIGPPTTIPYADVVKVKKPGLSKTKLTLIGVGAAVVVLAVFVKANSGLSGNICPLGCGP